MGVRLLFFVWLYNYKKLKAIKRLETDISPLRNNEAILLVSCSLTFFFRVNSKESQKKNKIWNIECMRKNETTKEVENLNNVVWNFILWKKKKRQEIMSSDYSKYANAQKDCVWWFSWEQSQKRQLSKRWILWLTAWVDLTE